MEDDPKGMRSRRREHASGKIAPTKWVSLGAGEGTSAGATSARLRAGDKTSLPRNVAATPCSANKLARSALSERYTLVASASWNCNPVATETQARRASTAAMAPS